VTTRSFPAALTTPWETTTPDPVWLVKIATGAVSPTHLYYTDADESASFDGATYSPRPLDVPEQRFEDVAETGSKQLRIGDADEVLVGHLGAGITFENQLVTLHLTDRSVLDAGGTSALSNVYICESVEHGEGFFTLNLRPLFAAFSIVGPRRVFTRASFPGLPVGPLA
jgi:hypothetical protein